MSPPFVLVLGLSVMFGSLATLLVVVGVATDHWEEATYLPSKLKELPTNGSANVFYEDERLYKIFLDGKAHYVRSLVGGIWRICDQISSSFRDNPQFQDMLKAAPHLRYSCFNYIPDYGDVKQEMSKTNGTWLVRMQNSAASCCIVSLMCLMTAAITGIYGLIQKQVSACMVTGVMYIVGGVFDCFSLVIMHTKVTSMQKDCYFMESLSPEPRAFCSAREVTTGWSIPFCWIAFSFMLVAFVFWLYLARCLRLEKAKTLI